MDMIEENVKLYDCMKRSEKQFIVEVSADETSPYSGLGDGCLNCPTPAGEGAGL